jgi:hypothetical protein
MRRPSIGRDLWNQIPPDVGAGVDCAKTLPPLSTPFFLSLEQEKDTMEQEPYKWTRHDKWLYVLSMLPFAVVFVGTAYLLVSYSIYLLIIFVALYIITNIFQAGCCVGCPYQGKYCPALGGVYLANLLSTILYKSRQFDPKFYKLNATAAEITLIVMAIYPLYWVFKSGWYLVPIYLMLIAAHFILFMPTQCEKCSYNRTCPGGQAWLRCRQWFGKTNEL